ncbi:hypothetical protein K505DRAFT_351494 [Melanomma pulvis-pyrius CBS 109.77]|uniref:F-box domain-containing protein n=1 Tax=Melanomma pulvis-pyrius CBS 109.77 TaxID=1314802 RepID=A0A6A6X5D5_9PLEO|nr:hypothetical protein K505DRAFT_351494 [Melanomma pulvis-pyrius CBS 109.77]
MCEPAPLPAHSPAPQYSNYLPDELLLEILDYIPKGPASQVTIATFCLVSRKWYDVAIPRLYESPYLYGGSYELFVRTICPSILAHIKKSELAGLVKFLDLSHIVHQGNKSVTARLLGRTKGSLEIFVAPQASFAINCWASLSKCTKLTCLDLSLVSECISYQSLNQTLRQLPELSSLYLPRCSRTYEHGMALSMNIRWPPRLSHLQLSGSVRGKFLWDMLRQPDNFPPTMTSLNISHCPGLDHNGIRPLLKNLAEKLTVVALHNLPDVKQGRFNGILEWLPKLKTLTMSVEYISGGFGITDNPPTPLKPKPLESLTLTTSGMQGVDPRHAFTAVDLFGLVDEGVLGRIRYIDIAMSTGWKRDEGAELDAIEMLLLGEVDKENWEKRRWHYEGLSGVPQGMGYDAWRETPMGRRMGARVRVLRNQ